MTTVARGGGGGGGVGGGGGSWNELLQARGLGGWVGGWVGGLSYLFWEGSEAQGGEAEEKDEEGERPAHPSVCRERWVGGWVGGWVGWLGRGGRGGWNELL